MTFYLLFLIPGLLLGIYAQFKLKSVYAKFIRVPAGCGLTGAQAARVILDRANLGGVPVREVRGHLTDHYDPAHQALFLSSDNYHGSSLAAIGVAAHEAGHALQHRAAYSFFRLRMMMVPATQFASKAYLGIILLGAFTNTFQLCLGIVIGLFAVITLFQAVTLPVEYDASRRARDVLARLDLVQTSEGPAIGKVLNAAALTYVAALVTSILQLLYFLMLRRD